MQSPVHLAIVMRYFSVFLMPGIIEAVSVIQQPRHLRLQLHAQASTSHQTTPWKLSVPPLKQRLAPPITARAAPGIRETGRAPSRATSETRAGYEMRLRCAFDALWYRRQSWSSLVSKILLPFQIAKLFDNTASTLEGRISHLSGHPVCCSNHVKKFVLLAIFL